MFMKTMMIVFLVFLGDCGQAFSQESYRQTLAQLKVKKAKIALEKSPKEKTEQSSRLLFSALTKEVFPAWYGTSWDFNGTSNEPGKGEIACGYFVSTTLKHIGFNLNRYRLAQQASSVIVKELAGSSNTNRFTKAEKALEYISKHEKGLFVVGLDFHVGFLMAKGGEVYFIHSDYINGKVTKEPAATSVAFYSSNLFITGKITNNQSLMSKWLKGTKIY